MRVESGGPATRPSPPPGRGLALLRRRSQLFGPSRRLGLSQLLQRLIEHDPDRGGQVEAAYLAALHRDGEALLRVLVEDAVRYPVGLVAEDQDAVAPEPQIGERSRRAGREVQAAVPRDGFPE